MKQIKLIVFLFILFTSSLCAETEYEYRLISETSALTTAGNYLEAILNNTLHSLQLVASTPEAKAGDWPGIKKYLSHLQDQLPGVYFYVMPDGNYYSFSLDYTNLNLSDRPYFPDLIAGKPVKGFPIYSRSSGKKSALMAAPVFEEGKVIGGLGASVFLDELHTRLNHQLALPQNYTWFVLDQTGNTMLDRDSDYIFMNPLTQGSDSMQKAIREALQNDSGMVEYEINGINRTALYRWLPFLNWWLFFAKIEGEAIAPPPLLTISLEKFVPALQEQLQEIDNHLAAQLSFFQYEEAKLNQLLIDLLAANPMVVIASFIDKDGLLHQIQPSEYKNVIGSDISGQSHVVEMQKTQTPILSDGFTAVEGFQAVVLTRPVFKNKKFIGSVNLLLRPQMLIETILKNTAIPADYELWIMQKDGRIIYDQDEDEIGRLLFSDPLYADYVSLQKLGRQIVYSPQGEAEYIFLAAGSEEKVIKTALWDTISLHGSEWRVVLAYKPYQKK